MIRFQDVPTNSMVRLNSLCEDAIGLMRRYPKAKTTHSGIVRFFRHGHYERISINASTIVSAKIGGRWQPVSHA